MADLKEAIRAAQKAVDSTPEDHPDRAGYNYLDFLFPPAITLFEQPTTPASKYSPSTDSAINLFQYTALGAIERLGSLINQLDCRLTQLEGKVEKTKSYIMGRLGNKLSAIQPSNRIFPIFLTHTNTGAYSFHTECAHNYPTCASIGRNSIPGIGLPSVSWPNIGMYCT